MLFFYVGTEPQDSSFGKIVTAASLGNLGSSAPVCQTGVYDLKSDTKQADPEVLIGLSCPFGELFNVYEFGQIPINDKVDCQQTQDESTQLDDLAFNFYPPTCHLQNVADETAFDGVSKLFQEQCKGLQNCVFKLNESDLPAKSCNLAVAEPANWQYLMIARCSSSHIQFGSSEVKVTKNLIGIIVVLSDLIMTFIFWCSMLSLKKLQVAQENEMEGLNVAANDFTCVVGQEPHVEDIEDLPGIYYAWAENICSASDQNDMTNPVTGEIDENQNLVWNVQLGMTNLGYLDYMKRMGTLLIQKKKFDKKLAQLQKSGGSASKKDSVKEEIRKKQV